MTAGLISIYAGKILVVDDNAVNVALLEAVLEDADFENVYSTTDPRQVLPLQREHNFDLILLDIRMPWLSGIDVLHLLKDEMVDDYLPVIVLTAQTDFETRQQALAAGAKDFITKPFDEWEVLLRIQNLLETRMFYTRQVQRAEVLEQEVRKRTDEISQTQLKIVRCLGAAGEFRDNETGAHVIRMSNMCKLVADKLGLAKSFSEMLLYASTMHDVGKIGIADGILLKPGRLNAAEWQQMKLHCEIGAKIIGEHDSELMFMARETALYHHERWDGTGYPHGISGEDIPLVARIATVCDVFDALTSVRPYKDAWPIEEAFSEIKVMSGSSFDPKVAEVFVDNIDEIVRIKNRDLD